MTKPFLKILYNSYGCLFFIIILTFTSCNQDEIDDTGIPLKISSVIFTNVTLRSTLTEGSLGIFRLAGSGYAGSQSNIKYNYNSGSSSWDAESPANQILLTKNNINLRAYYPYNSDTEYSNGTVALTSQLNTANKDLCYQKTNVVANRENNVNLSLDHAYSLITLSVTRDASYSETCAISSIAIGSVGNGTIQSSSLNLLTSTYGSGTTGIVTVVPGIAGISSGSQVTKSVLMVPVASITGDLALKLTVDGDDMGTTITNSNIPSLVAGTNYTISITLNGLRELTVTEVTSTDWAAQTVTNPVIGESGNIVESNCYIVQPGAKVIIPVSRVSAAWTQVNGSAYTLPNSWTTGLLWTTNSVGLSPTGSVASIKYNRNIGYIEVTAGSSEGNSVIAFYDNDGTTILWSWHIWVTNYNPAIPSNGSIYTYNSRTWMDRNLGAFTTSAATVSTMGLLYQWGRKDPFPGSASVTTNAEPEIFNALGTGSTGMITKTAVAVNANIVNAIQNPLTFYCGAGTNDLDWYSVTANTHNNALWGGASYAAPTAKTVFDPCPVGWRVPASNGLFAWDGFNTTTFPLSTPGDWNASRGRVFTAASNTYYPATAKRNAITGLIYDAGNNGTYWSASMGGLLNFSSSVATPSSYSQACGCSVRCVKE